MNLQKRLYLLKKFEQIIVQTIKTSPKGEHRLTNYFDKCSSPWKGLKISIVVFARDVKIFNELLLSITQTCSNPGIVELLVKFDTESHYRPFHKLLTRSPFQFKMLSYPRFNGELSQHYVINDLCRLSNGEIIWICTDDMQIVDGDWVQSLLKTRNAYKDNIYCTSFVSPDKKVLSYAITREWLDVIQHFADHADVNRWGTTLSTALNRTITIDEISIIKQDESKFNYGPDILFEECFAKQLTKFREIIK